MRIAVDDHGDTSTVILTRIRPWKNERRFYAASVAGDLFGNILLFRNWGRIGTAGRIRYDIFPGAPEATAAMEKLATAKRRRGYITERPMAGQA